MNESTITTEAEAVASIVRSSVQRPFALNAWNGRDVLCVPDGDGKWKAVEKDEAAYLPRPLRPSGVKVLGSMASLVAYVGQFEDTVPEFLCYGFIHHITVVLNPHMQTEGGETETGWGDWKAQYKVPLSVELRKWQAAAGRAMTHLELADWLKEAPGIQEPKAGDLLSVVCEFRSSKTGKAVSNVDKTGTVGVKFEGAQEFTELPELKVAVPAFDDDLTPSISFEVVIRPRVAEGVVSFTLVIPDLELQVKGAWKRMVEQLRRLLPEGWQGRVFDAAQ